MRATPSSVCVPAPPHSASPAGSSCCSLPEPISPLETSVHWPWPVCSNVVVAGAAGVVLATSGRLDPLAAGLVIDGLLGDVPSRVQYGVLVGHTVVVRVDEGLGRAVVVLDDRGVVDTVLVHVVVDLGLVL